MSIREIIAGFAGDGQSETAAGQLAGFTLAYRVDITSLCAQEVLQAQDIMAKLREVQPLINRINTETVVCVDTLIRTFTRAVTGRVGSFKGDISLAFANTGAPNIALIDASVALSKVL